MADGSTQMLITNLDPAHFPLSALQKLYAKRWGIETSFRDLKYTVGLIHLHSRKSDLVLQEIFAAFTVFNFSHAVAWSTDEAWGRSKYERRVNFSHAVYLCCELLRGKAGDIKNLLERTLQPRRPNRSYPRSKFPETASLQCTFRHADCSFRTFQAEFPPPACHTHFSKTTAPNNTSPWVCRCKNYLLASSPGNFLVNLMALDDLGQVLRDSIREGRTRELEAAAITLPPLLWDEGQTYRFFLPDDSPNFITQGRCMAETVVLSSEQPLEGKLVLIRGADPGYDWILSHSIAEFITAYGGANSHMAIRAAEFGIPAVIGVGEKQFARYTTAHWLEIDCRNRTIVIL